MVIVHPDVDFLDDIAGKLKEVYEPYCKLIFVHLSLVSLLYCATNWCYSLESILLILHLVEITNLVGPSLLHWKVIGSYVLYTC